MESEPNNTTTAASAAGTDPDLVDEGGSGDAGGEGGSVGRTDSGERVTISYAQNGEDIRLLRALRDVENGRYVEVGGQDPETDSISRAFYDRGWSGLIVEPMQEYADRYKDLRPRDDVRQVAVSDSVGTTAFYALPGTGLSTAVKEFADRHHSAGLEVQEREVPTTTLSELLSDWDSEHSRKRSPDQDLRSRCRCRPCLAEATDV